MTSISSYSDFIEKSAGSDKSFLLLYKSGSEQSNCALQEILILPYSGILAKIVTTEEI